MATHPPGVVTAASILPDGLCALGAQTRIDHQVAELQQAIPNPQAQIIALYTQRNMLSPVSRLPSELLSAVFIHCAKMYYEAIVQADLADEEYATDSNSSRVPTRGTPQSVDLSYVCRHWRNVALNCSTLWSDIFPNSPRWTDVFLSRSRQAPLRVHLKLETSQPEQIRLLGRVLNHTERIQELKLRVPSADFGSVSSLLSSPAPLLRSLTIKVNVNLGLPSSRSSGWSFFDGVVPVLGQLNLSWCPTRRLPSMLNNLTTCILRRSFRGTIAELTASLRLMPSLVHLELDNPTYMIPQESDTHSGNDVEELRFPHLLRLIIHENMSNIVSLLPPFIFSPQTEVKIRTSREDEDWIGFRSLLVKKFFSAKDILPPSIQILAIEFDCDIDWMASIRFSGSERIDGDTEQLDGGRDIPLQIIVGNDDETFDTFQHIVQDVSRGGYLASLQNACFTIRRRWDCGTLLEDTLGFIPELRSISLMGVGDMLGCLCSFLSFTPHHWLVEREDATGFGFAPSLEELVIDHAIFDHCGDLAEQTTPLPCR